MIRKIAFIGLLACLLVGWEFNLYAQERTSTDTLNLFNAHADTVRLEFDDTLHISASGKDGVQYAYRWDINGKEAGEENILDFSFIGQRKNKIKGSRITSAHAYYFDITPPAEPSRIFLDAIDTVCLTAFPEYQDSSVDWTWAIMIDDGSYHTTVMPISGPQLCLTARFEYGSSVEDWLDKDLKVTVEIWGTEEILKTASVRVRFVGKTGKSILLPKNEDGHSYHFNVFHFDFDRIYCHPNDTFYLDAKMDPDNFPEDSSIHEYYTWWESFTLTEDELNDDNRYSSPQIIFSRGSRLRDNIFVTRGIRYPDSTVFQSASLFIYWGIDPDAEIESDSLWVFFPQYPYSNLGGRVDLCLLPDAPLPTASDTMQVFNLGPWNRELDYVEYAWFDGTKDVLGRDSIVGTDSAFAYRFGRMDSVNPKLYAGMLVTRVASDSLWQDSCSCYVPCTDDACHRYDTVRIYLHRLPSHNSFFPRDSVLCAHLDLEMNLSDTAEAYHCYWLDRDSIEFPYGHDTARYTVQGMRGLDGFGAGKDTREPRFFQLRLDHKLCGVSYFDTLLVYDQVKPAFELPVHDTVICLNEPVMLDSLSPLVYRPFYNFEWNDGTQGSGYTFKDSGTYILHFFVKEDFAICGYDTTSDTIYVRWSDPAQTLITLEDTSFCEKLSVTLDATVPFPTTRYSWQEGNLDDLFSPLEDSTLFTDPIFKVDKTVSLALFVVDTMNCVNTRQIDVTEEECKPNLSIPNVFTPNGDGVNDVLKFRQIDYCYDVDILIVDRKGSHVLHQKLKNPDDFAWNGCLNNGSRKLPDGAYFYFISYKNAYGKKKYQSGSITILGSRE